MPSKKQKRHIVLIQEESTKKTLSAMKKELGTAVVSSEELSSKVKANTILSSGDGIYYKHLGIAVMPDMEESKLMHATSSKGSVLYWEEERVFYPVGELEQIEEIKETISLLNSQIRTLEDVFKQNIEKPWDKATFGLNSINLKKSNYTGKGINICILDTGLYVKHPDFKERTIIGKSFVNGEHWDYDGNGHGTHVTGTSTGNIAKDTQKRYGIASESNIFIAKVLSDAGSGLTSGILDGIDWAIEKDCRIISMSLGSSVQIGENPSPIFERVGRKALEKNTLIIAASGNDSKRPQQVPRPVSTPANAESIMAVGALDRNLTVANFSNAGINAADGGRVDISAAGVNVFSSYSINASDGDLYKRLNGTSMATPHVSGVAALYFEAFPHLTAAEIWLKIEKNARELQGQLLRDTGSGIVQAI